MELEALEHWSKIAYYALAGLGVLVAGLWTYRRYVMAREGLWNLKVDIRPAVHLWDAEHALLALDIELSNVGRVMVRPGTKGCTVSLRGFARGDAPPHSVLDWNNGKPSLTDFDLIASRPSAADGIRYEIEPGCAYKHVVAIVVPKSEVFMVRVTFWWTDNKDAVNAVAVVAPDTGR